MPMQTVFDAEGNAFTIEPVDAREWLKSGHYFANQPGAGQEISDVIVDIIDKDKRRDLIQPGAVESGTGSHATGAELFTAAIEKIRGKPGPKPKG
jgi:hypothetical protein